MMASLITQEVRAQISCDFDSLWIASEIGLSISHTDDEIAELTHPSNGMYAAIMANTTYSIPTVVHVVYLNNVNDPTHIAETQVQDAINLLNNDMRRLGAGAGTGADMNIEFCLAQRDPNGNSTSGVIHYDGTNDCTVSNICYFDVGFGLGTESIVKDGRCWPHEDYFNIWVVHKIETGALGLARYPGAEGCDDGVIIDYRYMGTGTDNRVLTHEVGHYLALRHTFEGDNDGNTCPPNADPSLDGDLCTDTEPHIRSGPDCILGENNGCAPSNMDLLKRNYLNYSDINCMNRFTADQRMRARAVIMGPRTSLTHSLGCEPTCPDVTAAFTGGATTAEVGSVINLVNASSSQTNQSLTYRWYVNGNEIATTLDFDLTITKAGLNRICLQADNGTCSEQTCIEIITFNGVACNPEPLDCNNIVLNGSFDNNTPVQPEGLAFHELCGWTAAAGFPRACPTYEAPTDYRLVLYDSGFSERLDASLTSQELELVPGRNYRFSFEVLHAGFEDGWITVALVPPLDYFMNTTEISDLLPAGSQIIFEDQSLEPDVDFQPNTSSGRFCQNAVRRGNEVGNQFTSAFTFLNHQNSHLVIIARDNGSNCSGGCNKHFLIDDVIIEGCCTLDFEIKADEVTDCQYSFTSTNHGDEANFFWSVQGGPQSIAGDAMTYTFSTPGSYEVCLTGICDDLESDMQVCTTIEVPDECSNCSDAVTSDGYALSCGDEEGYFASVSVVVDDGFYPCRFNELTLFGGDAVVTDFSHNSQTNRIDLSLEFATAPTGIYSVSLCGPNNEVRCFQFGIASTTECDDCQEITTTATATCVDQDPTDNIQVYAGTIDIPIPPGAIISPCGTTSTIAGFTTGLGAASGGTYSVPFQISTNNNLAPNGSGSLCLVINTVNTCFTFAVAITNPCPIQPTACTTVSEWELTCTSEDAGSSTYSFVHLFGVNGVFDQGYELCETGGFTTSYGDVVVNGSGVRPSGQAFFSDLEFIMDCNDVGRTDPMVLSMSFCKDEGPHLCYDFLIRFDCLDCESNRGTTGRSYDPGEIRIYPNPTADFLQIESDGQMATVIDIEGASVLMQDLVSGLNTLDVRHLSPGLYFVAIQSEGSRDVKRFIKL